MTNRNQILNILFFLIILSVSFANAQMTSSKEILLTTDWSPDGKYIAIGETLTP
ncbi:MAG: hypothetical protein IPJ13_01275 [Saprospiraceae bacterium]|nr:hypothetical protein [Saprospiraceae bacterium]